MLHEELTETIIGAAIEVHKQLGPGLLESVYQACLARELALRNIPFEQQKDIPVDYKGIHLDSGLRLDFLVAGNIIVELKVVETILPIHKAQLLTYLKLSNCKVGLMINFNVVVLKQGLKRFVL
jgi:GxxExxY protein